MKTLTLLLVIATVARSHEVFHVIFKWNTTDVVWPSEKDQQFAITHGDYIPANNFIAGLKFWKGRMYLTAPRWKKGVPVTLGVTSATPVNNITAPKLEPFPNWEMQKIGDCIAFQSVQSMEIDPKGRMWVIDSGNTSPLSIEKKALCPPKLVILDLEREGNVLRTYTFPDNVARQGSAFLNDIVLDHEDGGMAYITDSDHDDPGIIVYSVQNNTSWKIRHGSMRAQPEEVQFLVARTTVNIPIPVDGIALSPASVEDRQVYYSPLSSLHLYSIPTSVLKRNESNVDMYVKDLGKKSSQTDGMMMSAKGELYFGLLADDAVAIWDMKQTASLVSGKRTISRDHERMKWPDTFAFDEYGSFYCVTNSLQNFLSNHVNISVPNYRVVRARTGGRSYQYLENGTMPELPDIPNSSSTNRISFIGASGLTILIALLLQ